MGRRAQQVGARIRDLVVHLPEPRERAQQGVLHEVLGIPEISGQAPAVAVQVRAQQAAE